MSERTSPLQQLSRSLCPWLRPSLENLEQAHAGGRLGHAWLLAGARGTGKLNLALVFADRLLHGTAGARAPAELDARSAGRAMRERHVAADRHPDLHWIHVEDDKASIGVEQIRAAAQDLSLKGFGGGPKVAIIESAEAMTTAAANALLKTLEEPTPETYLLLTSHQPGRLLGTIRSRCQTLHVAAPRAAQATEWLAGLVGLEGASLATQLAFGGPLDLAQNADNKTFKINEIYDSIDSVYRFVLDPLTLAERWQKLDLGLILDAMVARTQGVIRERFRGEAWNSITDQAGDSLHNPWPALTLRRLFTQLDAIERLREQRGTGINMELALRVLLLGFQPDREAL